jgi:hypothetical protein
MGRGFASGFMTGGRIGLYALGVGAIPGAILGGLIGAVAGLFGGSDSEAEDSSTPTGSTCLCDMIRSQNTWSIRIHDFPTPLNIGGGKVRFPVTSNLDRASKSGFVVVPAPDSPQILGAATVSGRLENDEPWLILGHELCGHAWLQDHANPGDDEEGVVEGKDFIHHRSVERENKLRKEHGMEARGFHLKDPFCGLSFGRDRNAPNAAPDFFTEPEGSKETRLEECRREREKYFPDQARRFKVGERIP